MTKHVCDDPANCEHPGHPTGFHEGDWVKVRYDRTRGSNVKYEVAGYLGKYYGTYYILANGQLYITDNAGNLLSDFTVLEYIDMTPDWKWPDAPDVVGSLLWVKTEDVVEAVWVKSANGYWTCVQGSNHGTSWSWNDLKSKYHLDAFTVEWFDAAVFEP